MDNAKIKTLLQEHSCLVRVANDDLVLFTKNKISDRSDLNNLLGLVSEAREDFWLHRARFAPINCFVLRHALRGGIGKRANIPGELLARLAEAADKISLPTATISPGGKNVILRVPNLKSYKELLTKLGAGPLKEGYSLRLDKLMDLEVFMDNWQSNLPKISLDPAVKKLTNEPIPGYDGTVDSLREIPIGALNIVSANVQNYQALKRSSASMEEKLTKFKLSNLHELLFRLPRRYIDKSKPQLVDDLLEGEEATIVGHITAINSFSGQKSSGGVRITIEDQTGNTLTSTFWSQKWLTAKYKVGDEVLLTGGIGLWNGKKQLNGKSIEHFDEGVTLPIVPVYRQSASAGITSAFLISAIRELMSRMGEVKLPVYLKSEGRRPYGEILKEFHLPSSLEAHNESILEMAYYELVYLQLLVQDSKNNLSVRTGLRQSDKTGLQLAAAKAFPYPLTESQKQAVASLNKKLGSEKPSSSLLMADVGAGKTLVAQLAALRSVDAGFQAVIASPTDILARQIHRSTENLLRLIEDKTGRKIRIGLLAGAMKAAEKRELHKAIATGEIDIIVGTHAVFSTTVKYHNLGFVAIDEQQKFGAEQRSQLLNSREDGKIPDLLLQTATPIPRSMAQVYYGDMDPLLMKEKPQGRLPIQTTWLMEDPSEIPRMQLHPLWLDVIAEAAQGNQTFVIAPMVIDSDKDDAASVERTFQELSQGALGTLRVGLAHGQMKPDEQRETMEKFRKGELDVLVASTVVEVGVDVPGATRVVILSADRMGASSLHQIRGRVGRNDKPSKCYLVSLGKTENSQIRLQALVDHEDGFEIAKIDLKVRGEGTMFSSSQSGQSDMLFASLAQHSQLIEQAREEALRILRSPFKEKALKDANEKFSSPERLF